MVQSKVFWYGVAAGLAGLYLVHKFGVHIPGKGE